MNQAVNGTDPADIGTLVKNGHLVAVPTVPTGKVFVSTVKDGAVTPAAGATDIGKGSYAIAAATATAPMRATFNDLTSESYK